MLIELEIAAVLVTNLRTITVTPSGTKIVISAADATEMVIKPPWIH